LYLALSTVANNEKKMKKTIKNAIQADRDDRDDLSKNQNAPISFFFTHDMIFYRSTKKNSRNTKKLRRLIIQPLRKEKLHPSV